MGPLVLAKNFGMVAGGTQTFVGDWAQIDSEHQNATIHVHCQTISPTTAPIGFQVIIESSFDMVESYQVGTTIVVNATGSQSAAIAADLGPLVRLRIDNGESTAMIGVLSVWLQPKME